MVDAVGLDGMVAIATGGTLVASVAAFLTVAATGRGRPCWSRNQCILKTADTSACARCSVYLRAHDPMLALKGYHDLGEIRRTAVIGAAPRE